MKRKELLEFNLNNQKYLLKATRHFYKRVEDRKIEIKKCIKSIMKITMNDFKQAQNSLEEFAIVDKEEGITVIIYVDWREIRIVTGLKKTDCFFKKDTIVKTIA